MSINKKKLPGLSLVEVLVVIAIAATSMVSVANVNLKAQISIKDNETIDAANGIMIQALELAKSPTSINVVDSIGNPIINPTGVFKIEIIQASQTTGTIIRLVEDQSNAQKITTCSSASPYWIDITSNQPNSPTLPGMCAQVIITEENRPLTVDKYLKIESTVVFDISDQTVVNDIIGYRRDDYAL